MVLIWVLAGMLLFDGYVFRIGIVRGGGRSVYSECVVALFFGVPEAVIVPLRALMIFLYFWVCAHARSLGAACVASVVFVPSIEC
jgi:hypothetical protein